MSIGDQLIDQAAAGRLAALENRAGAQTDAAVDQATARHGLTAAALQAAAAGITTAIQAAVAQAVALGAAIAVGAVALLGLRRPRLVRRPAVRPPGPDVAGGVRDVLSAGTVMLFRAPDRDAAAQEIERIKVRLRAYATVAVNEGASAGAGQAARSLGADGLMWVAERDACIHCQSLSGRVVVLGGRFSAVDTLADRPLRWRRYTGSPPRHPGCRCRVVPWFDTPAGRNAQAALMREARRSIVRGFSMPSESGPARIRAARRLLARGANLPRSVEEYGRQAVQAGRFPRSRHIRTGAGRRPS